MSRVTKIVFLQLLASLFLLVAVQGEAGNCPEWPAQATRNLNKPELRGCDCDQLEKLRNEIYARHGRKFKRKDLQNYFGSQPWYKYDPSNPNGSKALNIYEKRNAGFIAKVESEKRCKAAPEDPEDNPSGCPPWSAASTMNLNKPELSGCDCDQLEKLRNEIFARHGRKFKRKDLQSYFESQSWYRHDPTNPDGKRGQNKYERRNVEFIIKVEAERGCRGD